MLLSAKNMITLQCKLELPRKDKEALKDLMRRQSACTRYAYKRLLKGKERNKLKKKLQALFGLNSRYVDDAILRAKAILSSCRERGQNPKKLVFGGRSLFEKLCKKHLQGKRKKELKREWRERRQGNLYSRGDKTKKGNPSPLRGIVVSGDWKRVAYRLAPVLGAGAMADPNTACWGLGLSEEAGYKYPSLKRNFTL